MRKSSDINRNEFIGRLHESGIVLLGYEKNAQSFITRNCNKVRIKCCLATNENHPQFVTVGNKRYDVLGWNEYSYTEDDYIVTTGVANWDDGFLCSNGLIKYKNYISHSLAETILSGKKIMIVAGNCQIVTIRDFLNQIPEVAEKYVVCRFSTHYWKNRYSLDEISLLRNFCSVYICLKHGEGDPLFFSRDELPEDCRIITLASYLSPIYWPQLKIGREKAYNDMFIPNPDVKGHESFEFGDVNINKMIQEGKDAEDILELIGSEDFYSPESVNRHLERIFRMMEFEEAGCDIKMSEYIKGQCKSEFLFRDFTHMQVDLIWEYVKRILELLGISKDSAEKIAKDRTNQVCESFRNHCTEIPIYPSVAKALGLKWCEGKKYDLLTSKGIEKVSFEEYVRRYYKVCKAGNDLKALW